MVNEIPNNGIILPHAICDSCGTNSGPIMTLPELRDRSNFLRENVIPTGIEREMALQDIEKTEEKISQIELEINQLKQVLTSLRQQRNILREFRNREKSLFAPIRKLPDDVLRHLFVTCQRCQWDDGFIIVSNLNKTFVATIMNVCAHWRHVARSSPELWSRIRIWNANSSAGPTRVAIEQFFNACISFSREMPLCLRISPALEDSCIQNIARCAYRWKEIDVRSGELFNDIMKYVDPELVLPSLERLSVDEATSKISINPTPVLSYFRAQDNREISELVTVSFKSAPCLRNLSVENVLHPMWTFIDLPWSQITTFESTFNVYNVNELALLLKSLSNLVSFTLEGKTNIKGTITLLPSLKTFMLKNEFDIHFPDVLDAFTGPHIETLHSELPIDPTSLFRFLSRSSCPLMDLTLTETFLDRECMEKCSSLRTVKKLHLIVPDPQWNDVLVLTQDDQPSGLRSHLAFPQLQSLEMQWVWLETQREFSDVVQPLIHMLKLRIAPIQQITGLEGDVTKLQEVTISFTKHLTQEEKNALYELTRSDLVRQSGVILNVSDRDGDEYIIRNGVVVDEETSDLETTNSSYDTNSDSEDTSGSSETTESR